jgi:hypothetical protein
MSAVPSDFFTRPDEGQDFVNLESDKKQVATVPAVFGLFLFAILFPSQAKEPFAVLLFGNPGEEESGAFVANALFHEKVSGMRIGLKICMGQSIAHDERHGCVIENMRPRVDGGIHSPLAVGGCQNAATFGIFEVLG